MKNCIWFNLFSQKHMIFKIIMLFFGIAGQWDYDCTFSSKLKRVAMVGRSKSLKQYISFINISMPLIFISFISLKWERFSIWIDNQYLQISSLEKNPQHKTWPVILEESSSSKFLLFLQYLLFPFLFQLFDI